jgi:hypothetical protein
MTTLSIQPPYPIITGADGQPLEDGYVWIGTANLNPQTNPIAVYWDAALTQPAAQPVRTQGGYPVNAGTPARLYVGSDYSILVQNKNGSTIYSAPAATERYSGVVVEISSTDVSFLQAGTGAVTRTAQSKMRDTVSVKDFGAVGDGVVDDYTAISNALSAAIAGGKQLVFPPGIYAHSGVINFASQGVRVRGDGIARIKYTGAQAYGVAVASDLNFTYDVWIENLFIEAGNSTYGFYVKNSAHGVYKDITIINSTDYGAYLEGSVLDIWENLRVTSNPPPLPGQTVTMPKYGLYLNGSAIAVQSTANTFVNPIIEGVTEIGIFLEDGANNTFIGGTSEGNSGTGGTWNGVGIYIGANSPGNTFNNTFCEANKSGDLICYGKRNNFLNCTLSSRSATIPYEAVKSIIFQAGSEQNKIIGSNFYAAEVIAGAVANSFEYCDSQFKVDDAGTRTQILWTRQLFNTSTIVPGFKAGNIANADPLVLDWYQEGTFTPIFGGSTGDGSVTFDIQDGTYTRIGNTVTFRLAVRVSLITSWPTGELLVKGLPFASSATISLQAVSVGGWSNITLPASRVDLTASVSGGTTTIQLFGCASGLGLSAVQASGLGASYILIGGSYTV